MNESMLQREFKSKDVQRMRNLITKNYNDKTTTQVGYTKTQEDHQEGDIWEENGKKWTIKNGIKQTVTRFDKLKQSILLPLTCPNCKKPFKSFHANKIMWSVHKMCLDCVIDMEHQLKKEGKYEEYTKDMIKKGINEHIREMEGLMLEIALDSSDESFVTEAGDIETWKGKGIDKKQILGDIQEYIDKLKNIVDS
jgi:hypothetical protein